MSISNFYSNLGKNTTECEQKHYRRSVKNASQFTTSKGLFIAQLQRQGYVIAKQSGNYITAKKGDEYMVLYFAWHNSKNSNYLINKYIKARVDYFAFCKPDMSSMCLISYDKIAKHCKTMSTSVRFGNNTDEKMLISDDWVSTQVIGTMHQG